MLVESLIIASALLAAQKSGPLSQKDIIRSAKPLDYHYTGGRYQDQIFQYRLVVPRPLLIRERYPLLVWLHGGGRNGEDNANQLTHLRLLFKDRADLRNRQFFILAVQCPDDNPQWFHSGEEGSTAGRNVGQFPAKEKKGKSSAGGSKAKAAQPLVDDPNKKDHADDMLTVAMEILRTTMQNQPVDEDRVYLAGPSAGGTACWEMAMRYPEVFAAVVPISSAGGDILRAEKLVNIPIWAFHNRDDQAIPPRGVEETITAVKEAGGRAELTLFDASGHNAWIAAFKSGAMEWMLAQRRGTSGPSPGHRPWRLWHVLTVPAAAVAVVWLGWWVGRRRRRKEDVASREQGRERHAGGMVEGTKKRDR